MYYLMCSLVRFDGNICIILPYSESDQHYYSYSRCLRILGSIFLQLNCSRYIPINKGTEGMQIINSNYYLVRA